MTKPIPQAPEEPKFIRNATAVQKWLAKIAVSMFFVVIATGWEVVTDIFKPDYIKALTFIRITIALADIVITAILGYQQLLSMGKYIIDFYRFYNKFKDEVKSQKKDTKTPDNQEDAN